MSHRFTETKPLTKTELINRLASKFNLKKTLVRAILSELSALASREVKESGEFLIPGLGKLVQVERRSRMGRNPQTGETISIPQKFTLKFRVSKKLKDSLLPGRSSEYAATDATELGSPVTRGKRREQARYVNVCFIRKASWRDLIVLPKSTNLATDLLEYYLRINIGAMSPDSVVSNAEEFPDDLLPDTMTGHWLEVAVVSDDFFLVGSRYHMFLPHGGESWNCDCSPGGEHLCTERTRRKHLFIPIYTPSRPGTASLRLAIYYKHNLIQSQLLTAEIAEKEGAGQGYSSYIDYTLSSKLSDISLLPARTLNILTNENADGTHKLIINGMSGDVVYFNLTEGQMSNAIGAVRQALRDIHILDKGGDPPQLVNLYDRENRKPRRELIADLQKLALLGWNLWTHLVADQSELQDRLPDVLLREPAPIQICRVKGSSFVFPWALVYDIPLTTNIDKHVPCRLLEEWDRADALIPRNNFRCPYESGHRMNVLCPFGFWGYKHTIEQPPSVPAGRDLPLEISVSNRPMEMVVGFSRELNENLTQKHLETIRQRLWNFKLYLYDSQGEIAEALANPNLELVYFYCHGRRQPLPGSSRPIPFISVGRGEMFAPSDVMAWKRNAWPLSHWRKTSPLIFINGCHTAEITPESLVSFVDIFFGVFAAGVIGTEVTLHQNVAGEAAAEFLDNFQTESVGRALQLMRRSLLLKGNLLGLSYTPYCSAALHYSTNNSQTAS